MKVHTTNYRDTFIAVAEDSPAETGTIPPIKGAEKTIAYLQFEIISKHPYKFTSDDILFQCYATKQKIAKKDLQSAREQFFAKGQPCFRASPLTKRYGWGLHSNKEGKVAIYGCETAEYQKFISDKSLKIVKAMKSGKKS